MKKPVGKPNYYDIHVDHEQGVVALVIGPPTAGVVLTKLDVANLVTELCEAADQLPNPPGGGMPDTGHLKPN